MLLEQRAKLCCTTLAPELITSTKAPAARNTAQEQTIVYDVGNKRWYNGVAEIPDRLGWPTTQLLRVKNHELYPCRVFGKQLIDWCVFGIQR